MERSERRESKIDAKAEKTKKKKGKTSEVFIILMMLFWSHFFEDSHSALPKGLQTYFSRLDVGDEEQKHNYRN